MTAGAGAFSGRARTLAGGHPAPAAPQPQAALQQPIVHTITFYNEGVFTVNDGGSCFCLGMMVCPDGQCGSTACLVMNMSFCYQCCWVLQCRFDVHSGEMLEIACTLLLCMAS